MDQELWTKVDRYLEECLLPRDPLLEAVLSACDAAGLPAWSGTPTQGRLLQLLAQIQGARMILEIGTLGAYSTIWLARGLLPGGRLVTLEADAKFAEVARSNLMRAGLQDVVELRLGQALDTLPMLASENRDPFDLIFIDADKPSNPAYLEWALRLSRPGTVILADNVVRNGDVIDALSDDPRVLGVRRMNEILATESRLAATTIQTVGCKGYDGFTIARVVA